MSTPETSRRRRPGPVDMVVTMLVLVAAVALLLLLVPAPREIVQPGADPVAAAAEADLGFAPAAVPAAALGEGWRVSYARVEEQEGVRQWRLGYLSPDRRRVDVEQAVDVTPRWLTREPGPPGEDDAAAADPLAALAAAGQEVDLAGGTWVTVPRAEGDRAFARRDGDVVTVLSTPTEAGLDPLEQVAAALDLG
ncbi:MAG: DUF4245 family protein [Kineosporiaceae bacterium]